MALDEPDPLDFDMITASLRADVSDINAFVETLAAKLEETMPGAVQVERARSGFRGPKLVREIGLKAGGDQLALRRHGNSVECSRARVSGGIVIKNEQLSIDEWLTQLGTILGTEAQRSAQTRQALERLLDI